MEIMGGEGRTTQCLVRRRFKQGLRVGRNMDLVCNVDLLDPDDVADMWRYIRRTRPLVILMSPPCTGMKGWAPLNAIINPDTHQANKAISEHLGSLCGDSSSSITPRTTFHP